MGNRGMPFSSWPLTFGRNLAETVGRIRRRLYPRRLPSALYHYTSTDGVLGIIDSRTLWATCVEDLDDQGEVRHGIEMVQAEVRRLHDLGVARFPRQVLGFLSEALSTRRAWTFVACFRAKGVGQERGPYCLQFDTFSNWEPRLHLPGLHADVQYHRVIYKPSQKRKAIRRAINSIVILAARNRRGDLQGAWEESIARIHARIASQSLMNIISSFKCCTFEWEDEWRIVCRPRCSTAGSAPDMDDDAFKPLIKKDEKRDKRYVELRVPQQDQMLLAFPRNTIPFSAIYVCDDSAGRDAERERIRAMLQDGGQSDIELRYWKV
jgi:hypothetical protein